MVGQNNSFRECWAQVKKRLNRYIIKWTCSRINSYFDPSVGSDWGSLMSICLAGISLAPGNPTGFLRIGEDSKVVRLELWRDTHSSTMSEWEHLAVLVSVCVCVCVGMCVKFKGLLVGANSKKKLRQGQALGWACKCVHARTQCSGGGVPLV